MHERARWRGSTTEQMPARHPGVAREMFETLAPEMGGLNRVLLSNLWLFGPLVRSAARRRVPSTNAMLRTTTALTSCNAGNKDNVLPGRAEARGQLPPPAGRQPATASMAHVQAAIANDGDRSHALPRRLRAVAGVADRQRRLSRDRAHACASCFPTPSSRPALMIGAHRLAPLRRRRATHVYKFSPVRAKPEDLPRFHGTNERISTANYAEMIQFYHQLLRNARRRPTLPSRRSHP